MCDELTDFEKEIIDEALHEYMIGHRGDDMSDEVEAIRDKL